MGQTDARTDIYCLGVTLYHLVTGQNPSEPPYELYPIRQWNPALSSGLEAIINKCTQLNPDDRYQSCDELMYALEHYEEMDDNYRKKQRTKLRGFTLCAITTLIMFVSGIVFNFLAALENDRNYEHKINISTSTDYDQRIHSYKEAIELFPYRFEAYNRLLQAYNDNNLFGDRESTEFIEYYNAAFNEQNENEYDISDEGYADMNYTAGITYFYLYGINDENVSLKVRALKAYSFFKEAIRGKSETYENYELAESYYVICDFYRNYVANQTNTREPSYEIYNSLVESLEKCIDNLEGYDNENLPYIKLSVYEAVSDLIFGQRKGLVATGISSERIMKILMEIYEKTGKLMVTQDKSIEKQNKILSNLDIYIDEIVDTYENAEVR